MFGEVPVETFRWRTATRRLLGADIPLEDADGSLRIVAEGDWLAVSYAQDGSRRAYIETVERAAAERSLAERAGGRAGPVTIVSSLRVSSAVGSFEWQAKLGVEYHAVNEPFNATSPFASSPKGLLTLPDGTSRETRPGSGFFEAPTLVRGYRAWRDVDEGWSVVTEVALTVRDEWRPILAAIPLLLFTRPPVA